jgi:mycothiol synthase
MERPLDELPPLVIPDSYKLRTYRPGDESGWVALVEGALGRWDEARARREFFADPTVPSDGIFFLLKGSQYVATATARRRPEDGPETGYVHMVAVTPEHRGRGLGYAASLAVLHRFRQWGLQRAILETEDWRVPAVRTYLRLGFKPVHVTKDHPRRWRILLKRLRSNSPGSKQLREAPIFESVLGRNGQTKEIARPPVERPP